MVQDALKIISTEYPNTYLTPTDKITRLVFTGVFDGKESQAVAMERRGSKKTISTFVSTQFNAIEANTCLNGDEKLSAYDREVHDALATLYFEGRNEYITPQMIYKVLTGNPNAFLNLKQSKAIHKSLIKCAYFLSKV